MAHQQPMGEVVELAQHPCPIADLDGVLDPAGLGELRVQDAEGDALGVQVASHDHLYRLVPSARTVTTPRISLTSTSMCGSPSRVIW